jgi:hypothetical protein
MVTEEMRAQAAAAAWGGDEPEQPAAPVEAPAAVTEVPSELSAPEAAPSRPRSPPGKRRRELACAFVGLDVSVRLFI